MEEETDNLLDQLFDSNIKLAFLTEALLPKLNNDFTADLQYIYTLNYHLARDVQEKGAVEQMFCFVFCFSSFLFFFFSFPFV
jgi:hypothetical protein